MKRRVAAAIFKDVLLAAAVCATLAACGTKSDLVRPDGSQTPAGQHDPSKPPSPLGQ